MNKISKEEWLATKVMKWTVMKPSGVLVFDTGQRSGMKLKDWQPDKDITQAMMLLDKYKIYKPAMCYHHSHGWMVDFYSSDAEGVSMVLSEAITEAVLKASNYYKENSNDN